MITAAQVKAVIAKNWGVWKNSYPLGDVNCDYKINQADIDMIVDIIMGKVDAADIVLLVDIMSK